MRANFVFLLFVSKFKFFAMKKIVLMAAVIAGCNFAAQAQQTPVKPTETSGELKTQKKGIPSKQTGLLKNTSANTAIAPLMLPMPKHEVDTTFLPV